jgi:hypothetical protein
VGFARAVTIELDLIELGRDAAATLVAELSRRLLAGDLLECRVGDKLGGLTHGKLSCSANTGTSDRETRRIGVTFSRMLWSIVSLPPDRAGGDAVASGVVSNSTVPGEVK